MRAIVQDRYGSADALQATAHPRTRDRRHNEVLVHVHAAGLDRGTWHMDDRSPLPDAPDRLRVPSSEEPRAGPRRRRHGRRGRCGGDQVHPGRRGVRHQPRLLRRVRGTPGRTSSPASPRTLSFEQAAVVPVSAGTALQALTDAGHVQAWPEGPGHRRPAAVSAAMPSSSPRRSAPRSPGCAAPASSTSCGPSVLTTSSTTPRTTSPTGPTTTTWSSTSAATRGCHDCAEPETRRHPRHRRRRGGRQVDGRLWPLAAGSCPVAVRAPAADDAHRARSVPATRSGSHRADRGGPGHPEHRPHLPAGPTHPASHASPGSRQSEGQARDHGRGVANMISTASCRALAPGLCLT